MFNVSLGRWDWMLLVAVTGQAALSAYLYSPRHKALILSLPIPFTLATLSVGRPVDAGNVAALSLLLLFVHGVRFLYGRGHVPIIGAIGLSAAGYCIMGTALKGVVPASNPAFWWTAALTLLLAIALLHIMPYRYEPGHRTPLPIGLKLPVIVGVVLTLILLKQSLQGFMTMFPMVGVITAYEARYSLWTICRQIPVVMLTMVPMMAVCRLIQTRWGLGCGLGCGWIVFIMLFIPLTIAMRQRPDHRRQAEMALSPTKNAGGTYE